MIEALVLVAVWYVIGLLIVDRWVRKAIARDDPRADLLRHHPLIFMVGVMLQATTAPAFALWWLLRRSS